MCSGTHTRPSAWIQRLHWDSKPTISARCSHLLVLLPHLVHKWWTVCTTANKIALEETWAKGSTESPPDSYLVVKLLKYKAFLGFPWFLVITLESLHGPCRCLRQALRVCLPQLLFERQKYINYKILYKEGKSDSLVDNCCTLDLPPPAQMKPNLWQTIHLFIKQSILNCLQ